MLHPSLLVMSCSIPNGIEPMGCVPFNLYFHDMKNILYDIGFFLCLIGMFLHFIFPLILSAVIYMKEKKIFLFIFFKNPLSNKYEHESDLVKHFILYTKKSYSIGISIYIICIFLIVLLFAI